MYNSVTPWTVARQAPLPMGFSRQEYWSALPFPSPGDLSHPRIKSTSPALQVDFLPPGKEYACNVGDPGSIPGKDPLKKGIATHSSILTWRSPRTIWCMGSQRVGHNWVTFTFTLYHLSHQGSLCFYGQCELWRGDFDCVSSAVATALSSGIVSIWRTCSGLQYPDRLSDLGSFFGSFGSQSPHQ